MAGVTVTVTGLKELDEALAQFTEATQKNILRRVGREALIPFDQAWRSLAPVDENPPARDEEGRPYVHLKDSGGIGSKLSKRQRRLWRRRDDVEVFAGPGADAKGVQQEFGNSHNAPQPFVRPAWDQTKNEVLERVKTGLGAEIDKVAQRAARKAQRLAARSGG